MPRTTFGQKILIGLGLGLATGLFLGELAAPLRFAADGFVRLLQMTVLPYVTVSLIVGIGSLDPGAAKRLFLRVGALTLALWALTLGAVFLMPLAFPRARVRVLLQHHPRGGGAARRLPRSLHPVESLPLSREQRGARGGAVQRSPRDRPHGHRAEGGAPRVAAHDRARARPREPAGGPAHPRRALRDRRLHLGDDGPRAGRAPAACSRSRTRRWPCSWHSCSSPASWPA